MMQESELSDKQELLVEAIADAPDQWVEPDEKTLHVQEVGNHSAHDMVQIVEEDLDLSVVSAVDDDVPDEYFASLVNFARNGDEWDVEPVTPRVQWERIREMYDAKGMKKEARLAAVRQLRSEATFATMRDGEKLYVYNDETGVFEDHAEQFIKERLDRTLREHYSKREKKAIVERIEAQTYTDRESFRQPETKVCVENGVLDLDTRTLTDHSPKYKFGTSQTSRYGLT